MNRRDFLHPRQIARTAGQIARAVELTAKQEPSDSGGECALVRAGRPAMGTSFEILQPFGSEDVVGKATMFFDEIDRLEDQLTVYRDSSEISRLNQIAAERAVRVEPSLFALLETAVRLGEATEGAFDITAGALVKAWGFFRGPRRVPREEEIAEVLQQVGLRHLRLDPEARTVRFLRSGMELNLGSVGKGYALDRAAVRLAQECKVSAALLHAGHSSVYAMGTTPGETRGWQVGIRDPWNAEKRLAILHLRDRALGTSAATYQHFEYNGRRLGHILDPRSGWPAEGIASASVVADSAAEADALATAFYILGVEHARRYCNTHPGVGAVLLTDDRPAKLFVFGLDSEID